MKLSCRHIAARMSFVAMYTVVLAGVMPCALAAETTAKPIAKTVRLFTVGNSFSQNAMRFLPDITKAAGNTLVFKAADIGGCPLQKHWALAEKAEADPNDPNGKPYSGKCLRELLRSGTWDFVTIQQQSLMSTDVSTYRPYAQNLRDYIKKNAPGAEVILHQTWEYRVDDPLFGDSKRPYTQKQMYDDLARSYRTIGGELGIRVIPVGDAFHRADTDPHWAFKPDLSFNPKTAVCPALPDQSHSLHAGWRWTKDKAGKNSLAMDGHHANDNGCYLAGCVWFEFLFGDSVVGNKFVPKGMNAETAAYLQKVGHETCLAEKAKGDSPAAPARLSLTEATARVRARIFLEKPKMNPAAQFPLAEITTDDVWNRLHAQLFRVTSDLRVGQCFLIQGDRIVTLGESFGGYGVMSFCVADLESQGSALIFTYSWGSGEHRSHVAAWRGGDRIVVSPIVFWDGDLSLRKIDEKTVEVDYGEYEGTARKFKSGGTVGRLDFATSLDKAPKISVKVRDDLPAAIRARLTLDAEPRP